MNDIQEILGGVNPFKEIPGLWFELLKTQYFVQCVMDNSKEGFDQQAILNNACEFAMGEVKKRFPKLDCSLTKKEPTSEVAPEVKV